MAAAAASMRRGEAACSDVCVGSGARGRGAAQVGGCEGFMGSALGYSLKLLNCMITASATVYNEKFMKSNDDSIHFQNLQLYFFGFLFGTSVTATELGWDVLNFRVSNPTSPTDPPSRPRSQLCML
jgi:hypothetical protein